MRATKRRGSPLWLYGLTGVTALLSFFPVVWLFLTSIKRSADIYAWPPVYIPARPALHNYAQLLAGRDFPRYIANSVIVSGLTTVLVVALGGMAAYSLARLRWRGRSGVMVAFLAVSMFPVMAIVPSLFLFFRRAGLTNTFTGLIMAHAALFMPLAVWILTTYFRTVPMELEEAARVDGCSPLRTLWSIILPLALPGMVAAGLIVFIMSWNEFAMSLVLLSKNELRTAVVGISLYPGEYAFPWETISAATFLAILPLLLLTVFFQRYIVGGLTAGATKM